VTLQPVPVEAANQVDRNSFRRFAWASPLLTGGLATHREIRYAEISVQFLKSAEHTGQKELIMAKKKKAKKKKK
jgi:hypothetical protein